MMSADSAAATLLLPPFPRHLTLQVLAPLQGPWRTLLRLQILVHQHLGHTHAQPALESLHGASLSLLLLFLQPGLP